MINRDFNKSNKEYIKQNKFVLIALAVLVAMGAIMLCVFGFKGGADVKGYNTFSINMGTEYKSEKMVDYNDAIKQNLASHDADLQSVQLTGEGDSTTLVIKYSGKVDSKAELNKELAEDLKISASEISDHTKVGATLNSNDYIYAVACGLIIVALAAIYAAFRYNLACAITALGGSLLGSILLMALTAIFRLTINSSFLAINIITILLILAESCIV